MLYDFTLLLPGNTYVMVVKQSEAEEFNEKVKDAIKKPDALLTFESGNKTSNIRAGSIFGWYYNPHEKSFQEQALNAINKSIDPPEDDWKNGYE